MTTALRTCIIEPGLEVRTRHTQTCLIENQSQDRFLIPSSWTRENYLNALLIWANAAAKTENASEALAMAKELGRATTRRAFAKQLDAYLSAAFIDQNKGLIKSLRQIYHELLITLWTKDCIIWPSEESLVSWPHATSPIFSWSGAQTLVNEALGHLEKSKSARLNPRFQRFTRLLLSRSFIDDVMNLSPRSDARPLENNLGRQDLSAVAKMIIDLQRQKQSSAQHFECIDFTKGHQKKFGTRSDPEFRWAIAQDQRWDKWREEATAYLAMLRRGRTQAISALNAFFDYAQEHGVPYDPAEFFVHPRSKNYPALPTGRSVDNPRNAMLKRFLDHVLDEVRQRLLIKGEHHQANLLRLPMTIPEPSAMPAPTQSHRDPMPQHLVELCIKILTENDYAWPKSFMGRGASDWMTCKDPITGRSIRVWSPVRASVLLAKLMLPARTMQIRMLDSGEADNERYEPANRSWYTNASPLVAHTKGKTENGVFRAYPREDGTRGSLIYFNTNKTADINQPLHKRGHLMAWEHEGSLNLFASLRDWQEKYNPLSVPTPWTAVGSQRCETTLDLKARGSACFLFRDPTQPNPTIPITNAKVQTLWARLMEEAEKRLAEKGELRRDGSPIQLVISRTKSGTPARLAYDLHSLRVTMITALYDNGVPVDRLMKVAGHCATVMTLYYVKESREKISLTLTEANDKRRLPQKADEEWKEFLKRPAELPKSLVSSMETPPYHSRSRVIFMDKGLCLNAAQACPKNGSSTRDCMQCPHFATGPGFLPGLQSECEGLLDAACHAGTTYQNADLEVGKLRLQRSKGECTQAHLDSALIRLDRCAKEVDGLNRSLFAAYAYTQQCIELAKVHSDVPVTIISEHALEHILRAEQENFDPVLEAISHQTELYQMQPAMPSSEELSRLRYLNKSLGLQKPKGYGFQIPCELTQAITLQSGLWAKLRTSPQAPDSITDSLLGKLFQQWEKAPQKIALTYHQRYAQTRAFNLREDL
jgi:hypothetical protein